MDIINPQPGHQKYVEYAISIIEGRKLKSEKYQKNTGNKLPRRFNKVKAKKKLERHLWKIFRNMAISRDKGCIICGSKNNINVHHIYPKELGMLKYNLNNLVVLCVSHHKYNFQISAHKNGFAFYKWLMANRTEQIDRLEADKLLMEAN